MSMTTLQEIFSPFKKDCNICNAPYEPNDDENWIHGFVGVIPVTLCSTCYDGMVQMVCMLEDEFEEDELE